MKLSQLLHCLLLSAENVVAHYIFARISHNGGEISKMWQYVRNVTTGTHYLSPRPCDTCHAQQNPHYDIYDENFRCGRGAAASGGPVETLKVNAGDELVFYSSFGQQMQNIAHPGPGQAYLSRALGALETYRGDGDWFKIASVLAKNDTRWEYDYVPSMNFTIPKSTPPGKNLMRVEHFYLSYEWNQTQWFINCAHIDVNGPGGGTPGPLVKIPGAYDSWDSNIWAPYEIAYSRGLTKYVAPGPPVWSG